MEGIRTAVIILFVLIASAPAAAQQRHAAAEAALDQAIADHVRQKADDRAAVQRVLEIEQVRELANGIGLDLKRADAAIATLDDAQLGTIAAEARAASDALAGGQSTITISTTAIIIGLLVLILLIVAI